MRWTKTRLQNADGDPRGQSVEQGSFSPPAETTSLSSAELSLNDAVVEVAKRAGMEAARVATNELLREVRKDQSKPPAAAQLRTIKQFAEECPAFSEAALYKLVARSETNQIGRAHV